MTERIARATLRHPVDWLGRGMIRMERHGWVRPWSRNDYFHLREAVQYRDLTAHEVKLISGYTELLRIFEARERANKPLSVEQAINA